jgi:23S rRNA (uracil1939-C5)-methyltransferase
MDAGQLLTLEIEKAVVGGRMLARHEGRVVLVAGAIPGERVRARVTRVARGVTWAETIDVLDASPDRRDPGADPPCGGRTLAHVAPARQRRLKAEIVADALARTGRITLDQPAEVVAGPPAGYRMRARLHVTGGRVGFYREGTHTWCDPAATGQLLPATAAWLEAAGPGLVALGGGLRDVDVAEDIPGHARACHLDLDGDVDLAACARLAEATRLTGLSIGRPDRPGVDVLAGDPRVTDTLDLGHGRRAALTRHARAFFQGNRFLVEPLARHVADLAGTETPVVDLYAGVGLFGLALAARGADDVVLVEGDDVSGADLAGNVEPWAPAARVVRAPVETFLAGAASGSAATVVVDPPRTGLSPAALDGLLALTPSTLIYVSCDPATFARDTRRLREEGGYALDALTVFDLFPDTAHVETVARFRRAAPGGSAPGRSE